jgi:hypothetical protein
MMVLVGGSEERRVLKLESYHSNMLRLEGSHGHSPRPLFGVCLAELIGSWIRG